MAKKTKGIIIAEKIFNRIYLLSGIGFFISGVLNIFSKNWSFVAIGLIFGVLIIYVGIGNIKSEGGETSASPTSNEGI